MIALDNRPPLLHRARTLSSEHYGCPDRPPMCLSTEVVYQHVHDRFGLRSHIADLVIAVRFLHSPCMADLFRLARCPGGVVFVHHFTTRADLTSLDGAAAAVEPGRQEEEEDQVRTKPQPRTPLSSSQSSPPVRSVSLGSVVAVAPNASSRDEKGGKSKRRSANTAKREGMEGPVKPKWLADGSKTHMVMRHSTTLTRQDAIVWLRRANDDDDDDEHNSDHKMKAMLPPSDGHHSTTNDAADATRDHPLVGSDRYRNNNNKGDHDAPTEPPQRPEGVVSSQLIAAGRCCAAQSPLRLRERAAEQEEADGELPPFSPPPLLPPTGDVDSPRQQNPDRTIGRRPTPPRRKRWRQWFLSRHHSSPASALADISTDDAEGLGGGDSNNDDGFDERAIVTANNGDECRRQPSLAASFHSDGEYSTADCSSSVSEDGRPLITLVFCCRVEGTVPPAPSIAVS